MSKTKANIIANFTGRSVTAILGIVFVPIYLRYLSVEIYGIIGFFSSIQAFLVLFDGGVSPTLNREVARLSAFPEKTQELNDLSRTLETLCWGTGFVVCIIALLASPIAANYWLTSNSIPTNVIRDALVIMSVTFAFQWGVGFYMGGLYGLQEQKLLNAVSAVIAVARSFGAYLVLAFFSPTIKAFLLWQLFTTIINCALLFIVFWKKLPSAPNKPSFKINLLKKIWRYAAGLAGTGLVVLILTQTDKLILSKLLKLEEFGYYSLAVTLAGTGIGMIVGSIQSVYFPQFSQLVAQDKHDELRDLYHRACQVMSLFLIPVVSVLSFFSYEILLIWTQKQGIAQNTYLLLTIVAIGTGLNGLMHLPYYAQLAFGITKIGFWQNVIAIIILIPLMIYGTLHYGAIGGAVAWMILNLGYVVFTIPFMHRLILKGEQGKWYLEDVGLPVLISILFNTLIFLFFKSYLQLKLNTQNIFLMLVTAVIISFVVNALSLSTIRQFGLKLLRV